jgi:hypothetical protein
LNVSLHTLVDSPLRRPEDCTTFIIRGNVVPFLTFHALAKLTTEMLPESLAEILRKVTEMSTATTTVMATLQINFRTNTVEEQPMAKDKLKEELAQAHSTQMTTECFRGRTA